jgi:hypothetical protein
LLAQFSGMQLRYKVILPVDVKINRVLAALNVGLNVTTIEKLINKLVFILEELAS